MAVMSLFSDGPESSRLSAATSTTPRLVEVAYSKLPFMPEKTSLVASLATSTGAMLNLPVMSLP
ncbi:hypothetical protein D3C87_2180810 [compost metagenome]